MPTPDLNLPLLGAPGEACATCGAPLAADQRYCLECGARRGPARLDPLAHARGAAGGAAAALVAPAATTGDGSALATVPALLALGRPRVLAIAAMLVLGFGVAVGAAAGPPAATGLPPGSPKIVVAAVPAPTPATPDVTAADATVTDATATDTTAATGDVTTADTATAAADTTAPAASPPTTKPADTPATPSTPATPKPPAPVKHVWVIPLREAPPAQAFDAGATTPVVPDLVQQGTVLTGYSSVAPGSLANRIAMISGQAPTASTASDCPAFAAMRPGTIAAKTGLVKGDGCVYPPKTVTLTDQFTGDSLIWKGYFEDMGAGVPTYAETCRHPDLGQTDPFNLPRPGDAYLTRSNPFVYFRSITESADCGPSVVGLDRLTPDLATAEATPAFSFVSPNACHDGSATPCAVGADAGLPAANAWLATIVPQITASPAYADGGLVVITFDGAAVAPPPHAGRRDHRNAGGRPPAVAVRRRGFGDQGRLRPLLAAEDHRALLRLPGPRARSRSRRDGVRPEDLRERAGARLGLRTARSQDLHVVSTRR